MAQNWTLAEVEATVADYFAMLDLELRGVKYNKAAHNRRLATVLNDRSGQAIEWKHQNISAVLLDLGFVPIQGYKPRCNYQKILFEVVAERLDSSQPLVNLVKEQVVSPAEIPTVDEILSAMVDPPKPDRNAKNYRIKSVRESPRPRIGVDYLAMEARNSSLGAAGEEFVVRFETARLAHAGDERLASKVERVSETRGDGLGYDILSFETTGEERLIEVKTTAYGPSTPFYVTPREVNVSREESGRYHLYRAFNFRREPKLFARSGNIEQSFSLEASQFKASI